MRRAVDRRVRDAGALHSPHSGCSGGKHGVDRRGDIAMVPDRSAPPAAFARELGAELAVVFAANVKQHVEPRESGGPDPGVRPGVVHAVRDQ